MSRKVVKITAIVISAIFLFGIVGSLCMQFVFAASLQEQLNQANKEQKAAEQKRNEAQGKRAKTLEESQNLEREIYSLQEQVDTLTEQISETDSKLAVEVEKLEIATKKAENQYDSFKERFRVMCEDGATSYLEILFSAESFSDLIDRLEIAKEISSYDKEIFDVMENSRLQIEASKNAIETLKAEQESRKAQKQEQTNALEAKKAENDAYVKELQADIANYDKVIAEKERAQDALRQQIASSLSTSSGGRVYVGGEFMWPATSTYITSPFSPNRKNPVTGKMRKHTGVDIGAAHGTSIKAANAGTVTLAGWNSGYGYCVIIDHGGGRATLYGHMSKILVSKGQSVNKGTEIGKVGSTGNSTGPHLHFEILINGSPVNPMNYFS